MKKLKFDVSSWEKVQKKPGEFGRIFLGISVGLLKRSSKERPDSLELNRIRNQLTMYQTVNSTVESIYIYSAASDLILSSGSLLLASELEEFPDEGIQRLLEHTEELEANSLILRKTTGVYHIDQDEDQKVYTKILPAGRGSMVVVNLDYDEIVQGILSTDILNERRMLLVNGGEESLVDVQTAPIDLTEELLDVIGDMEQSGTGSREVTLDGGEKYFVSCLHSEASGWDYIKITRWNEVFGILRSLTEWTIIIVAVIVGLMLLMIARSAVSVLRLQRLL